MRQRFPGKCSDTIYWDVEKKGKNKRSVGTSLVYYKMAGYEGTAATADTRSGYMIFEPILEGAVFCFDCSADDKNAAFPSVSFVNPRNRETPILAGHKVPSHIPTFECVLGQQIVNIETVYSKASLSLPYMGCLCHLSINTSLTQVFTSNTDAWDFGPGTTSLYQSHPWALAILPDGGAIRILADTTRPCEIDLRKESNVKLISQPSYPIITFGPFASPTDVLISLSHATLH
ncbi:hypothetical protein ACH5RR_039218 [Cinchona calisaya]|uniref:Uncharacterized protein n=1 Tax=Cinchona calisaya TaxID=153742 RepID=A0ABD2Y2V5_9GENT